ncbi:MAG: DUF6198 family protein [Clostridia bacterium]|nr:DUF6198 family protein [Clostridia bacterium]
MKKIKLKSELVYILANVLMAFSVALLSAVDFGLSMIVSPAFILSQVTGLTFGVSEYIVQAILFIILCLIMRTFKPTFFFAFITCLFYGAILDCIQLIPFLQAGALVHLHMFTKIVLFIAGIVITSFAVSLHFKAYIFPQVYDFFVSGVTVRYALSVGKFKWIFDITFLIISLIMSFCFFGFGNFVGIGWGTLVMALFNGFIIGFFSKMLDKFFEF